MDVGCVAGIGITNQRETVVVWDRSTGEPIHRAIVWQDRRTAETCDRLKSDGAEAEVRAKTGLLLDPYFSATKIAWILDNVAGARDRAERGELAAGTIDSFLLWRLTGGAVHATDATNASRTSLFDIHRQCWDAELCRLFDVPEAMLPEVHDNSHVFGVTAQGLFDRQIPIAGMAGDQQAALFGQACFEPGMVKSTYGTGCFMLVNTGSEAVASENRLLTTPAYRLGGKTTYALEGSIFVAGAAVKWLRDGLGVIAHASDTDGLATRVPDSHGVYMVPAFVGLGAPHWDPKARGALFGLTLDATGAHLARAALEATAYQTRDLIAAMVEDGCASAGSDPRRWRNDGERLALPVPRRHPRRSGRAAGEPRDDRARRGLSCRAGDGRLVGARRIVADLGRSRPVRKPNGAGTEGKARRRLGRRGRPDAQPALTIVTCATSIAPPRKPPSQYIR